MCLAVFSWGQHPRFPLVLAANRDEFYNRPSQAMDWWQAPGHSEPILAGRDLSAGGTWLGLSASGRLALLTNVREPALQRPEAPSRGSIVPDWLSGGLALRQAHERWQQAGHNSYNVIVADLPQQAWHWTAKTLQAPMRLPAGLHGLSNASLDTPWPKVQRLKFAVTQALQEHDTLAALVQALFGALVDPRRADDSLLPATGLPLTRERELSAAFIRTADGHYGTRCATVIVQERCADGLHTHVLERSFNPQPGSGQLVWAHLPAWSQIAPAEPTPVLRYAQDDLAYGTTLPSDLRKASAS
jgi:uncharacterized protein with NRDE domain